MIFDREIKDTTKKIKDYLRYFQEVHSRTQEISGESEHIEVLKNDLKVNSHENCPMKEI